MIRITTDDGFIEAERGEIARVEGIDPVDAQLLLNEMLLHFRPDPANGNPERQIVDLLVSRGYDAEVINEQPPRNAIF